MPGIPQVWYLDIFAGKNNYEAADKGGSAGHKEINRTTLTLKDVEVGLKANIVRNQLELIRLRNTSKAFAGTVKINDSVDSVIDILWTNQNEFAHLKANLTKKSFHIQYSQEGILNTMKF